MNKRKLYIPSLIGFFFTIIISQNVSFSQSKKKQIEGLNLKIDSFILVIANERNTQKTSIGSLEIQEFKSKQKVDTLTIEIKSIEQQISTKQKDKQNFETEISQLKKEIDLKKDSLKQLLSNEEERLQISSDDSYFIFFKDDYDLNIEEPVFNPDNGYSDQIVEKEKNRISSSKHATRKVDLKINLLNGSVAIYKSSFKDYTFHTYYSYLFEDLKTSKIFFVQIDYIDAGGGSKNISLLELNLKDGKVRKIIEDAGGDFFFNSNNTFVISSGWVKSDEEEYAQDCKLELINIDNLKKELVFNGIEPVEIKWNSRNEFQCMLLKYGKEIEWPFTRIPSDIRTSELFNFKLEDSIWQGYSTVNFDKKKYKIAVIGSNIWMAENLNVSNFRNGNPIPEAKTDEEWKRAGENKQPAWCYYNYDPKNLTKYGKLYNWFAVNNSRGLAPKGWHIATNVEWGEFIFLERENKLKILNLNDESSWWSSTEYDNDSEGAYGFFFSLEANNVFTEPYSLKNQFKSVRCIKD